MESKLALWQPDSGQILPSSAKLPAEIVTYAPQLGPRDRKQIVAAFDSEFYEMGINFLWGKTVTALRKELSTVGIGLIGEMLGRTDVNEDDDIEDVLTTRDALRLAEELGVVSSTDAMRLRHTYEIVTHFSKLDMTEAANEEIDHSEALAALKACVKGVLGRPKVEVAKKFVEFRSALEGATIDKDDPKIEMLRSSPYFFLKLTISVLMNGTKKKTGAQLEHVLANTNTIVPSIWSTLRDPEKWQIGHTYAEVYSDGKKTSVSGLKSVLLKVRGFDFVPENLRSDTFIKAADEVMRAHEGMNNFYNEHAPVKNLAKLGTTIPTPAFPACATALLSIILGNRYGVSWAAAAEAKKIVDRFTADRWQYYLNQVLPTDTQVLIKLHDSKPAAQWAKLVDETNIALLDIKNKSVSALIKSGLTNSPEAVRKNAQKVLAEFYGKSQ
ncbi:hypothetical protein [Rhizobium arsenicireducens]